MSVERGDGLKATTRPAGALKIPVSAVVVTRNEEERIGRCLQSLQSFGEVIVVDSASTDRTVERAQECGARVVDFRWNGHYPKKRQWCLDKLNLSHEWVLFVDADEVVTPELAVEIAALDLCGAGYFIDGLYVVGEKILRKGVRNKKLCLIHRGRMMFPVVDDLSIPGMGEIEGHYQPVLRQGADERQIGFLNNAVLHYAFEDRRRWIDRHAGYACWEEGMRRKKAYPADPCRAREGIKKVFRAMPCRSIAYFLYVFILRGGFLEGRENLRLSFYKALYHA